MGCCGIGVRAQCNRLHECIAGCCCRQAMLSRRLPCSVALHDVRCDWSALTLPPDARNAARCPTAAAVQRSTINDLARHLGVHKSHRVARDGPGTPAPDRRRAAGSGSRPRRANWAGGPTAPPRRCRTGRSQHGGRAAARHHQPGVPADPARHRGRARRAPATSRCWPTPRAATAARRGADGGRAHAGAAGRGLSDRHRGARRRLARAACASSGARIVLVNRTDGARTAAGGRQRRHAGRCGWRCDHLVALGHTGASRHLAGPAGAVAPGVGAPRRASSRRCASMAWRRRRWPSARAFSHRSRRGRHAAAAGGWAATRGDPRSPRSSPPTT